MSGRAVALHIFAIACLSEMVGDGLSARSEATLVGLMYLAMEIVFLVIW